MLRIRFTRWIAQQTISFKQIFTNVPKLKQTSTVSIGLLDGCHDTTLRFNAKKMCAHKINVYEHFSPLSLCSHSFSFLTSTSVYLNFVMIHVENVSHGSFRLIHLKTSFSLIQCLCTSNVCSTNLIYTIEVNTDHGYLYSIALKT